jgi:pimeloyl-ACP methyl ester carboxylesterase
MTFVDRYDLVRPDATLRYGTGGAAGGPTVVLLHGATLDHRAWAPQVEALQGRFRLVVPDLRAHGESTGSFDFEAAVGDVFALLDALPAGRVVLVGLRVHESAYIAPTAVLCGDVVVGPHSRMAATSPRRWCAGPRTGCRRSWSRMPPATPGPGTRWPPR